MKNLISHERSIIWNALTPYYQNANSTGEYVRNVRGTHTLKQPESPQTFRGRNESCFSGFPETVSDPSIISTSVISIIVVSIYRTSE